MKNIEEKTEIQQRIENAVSNGSGYHDSSYVKVGRFQDPIQAYLGRMEKKNPSLNDNRRRFLQWASGITALLDRALQYRSGELEIYKHSGNDFNKYSEEDFRFFRDNLNIKIINKDIDINILSYSV